MRRSCCATALVAASVLVSDVAGQVVLTEAEALAHLSPESPRVRALRAEIDLARADVSAASRFPNPRVTLSREGVAGVTEDFFLMSQPLPVTGRRTLETRAAQALVRGATYRVADLERRARAELRLAFARVREHQLREQELATSVGELRELADILLRREQAGDAAGFDRLRAEREVLDAEADVAAAASARVEAQAALVAFFWPAVDPLTVRVVMDQRAARPLPTTDELVARAEGSRGELLALQQEVEASRLSAQAASRRNIPEPEVVAGAKSSNAGGSDRGGVVSVIAALPLFDRSRPEKARAQAFERRALAELELRRSSIRADVASLREIVLQRRRSAETYRANAVTRSDELRRIARVSYDAGERGILELLDAYRASAAARVRLAELDAAVARAEIELEFVSGWENLR